MVKLKYDQRGNRTLDTMGTLIRLYRDFVRPPATPIRERLIKRLAFWEEKLKRVHPDEFLLPLPRAWNLFPHDDQGYPFPAPKMDPPSRQN